MTPQEQEYREIILTKGQVARVSANRYEEINQFKWFAFWNKLGKCYYAARKGKNNRLMFMHRQILGLGYGEPLEGDHVNKKETLNNTNENLQVVDEFQQAQHRGKRSDNTSGFKWVYPRHGKFRVEVTARKVRYDLGYFDDPTVGYAAACELARRIHGKYACFD